MSRSCMPPRHHVTLIIRWWVQRGSAHLTLPAARCRWRRRHARTRSSSNCIVGDREEPVRACTRPSVHRDHMYTIRTPPVRPSVRAHTVATKPVFRNVFGLTQRMRSHLVHFRQSPKGSSVSPVVYGVCRVDHAVRYCTLLHATAEHEVVAQSRRVAAPSR
jgi:hypothetical protein